MRKLLPISTVLILSLAACRSGDDGGSDSVDGGGSAADAAPGSATSIYDVQSESISVGSSVSLRSVVVTAIDNFGGRTGGFYVQESDGGAFSGVFVFGADGSSLAVGDVVDVDGGVKDEFSFDFPDGNSITQVVPPDGGAISVTKVGDGTVPDPEVLNAWDLAADDVEAEKWEGVLIQFNGIRALGSAFGVSQSDATLLEMSITGPYRMGGSLAQLDEAAVRDDCYSSITGIGDYFFNYKILPRSAADMVADASGDSCLPPEDSAELCDDSMDNDHDGFGDCADFSCQDAVAACTVDTTVVEAQDGTIAENTLVRLSDVMVTAIHDDGKKFFVQDQGGAAEFNGLFVFRPGMADDLPANMSIGSLVTIKGNVDEFDGQLTELTNVVIESSAPAGGGSPSILTGVSFADLASDAKYEGVLVEISNVEVGTPTEAGCTEFCDFTVTDGTTTLSVNDDIFRHTATAGQCFGTFRGIMHFDTFNDRIVVLPRSGSDLSLGGACN